MRETSRPATARRRLLPFLLAGLALLVVALAPAAVAAVAPQPGQRIDLKVLLLSADGREATFGAWKAALEREGVPYEAKIADAEAPFTDATFADYASNHARYQAVILATGDLVHQVTNADGTVSFPSSLSDAEWTALARFQLTFGIRQISDATFPSLLHGLNPPANTGEQGGNTGQLTAAGRQVFPYLQGPVPIDNPSAGVDAFGHQATPAAQTAPASFQTLVSGPAGSSYLGIHEHADGREEMVMTVDSNEHQIHAQLLRHGMLGWVTRGAYLGYQRNYLEMQVDDVFLPDARWDATLDRTLVDAATTASDETPCNPDSTFVSGGGVAPAPNPVPPTPGSTLPPCRPIRMTAADVTRLLNWQTASGITLDMVFNGGGIAEFLADSGAASDAMGNLLLANRGRFHWINHTLTHLNLDLLPGSGASSLTSEIGDNIVWARANGLPFDPEELVTGEHSGLHNAAMPVTLNALGVRWVAADNSREPVPYAIGSALTVPRYPTNVFYNVASQAEQLDEYNHIYLPPALGGRCVASATNTCRTAPATWAEYVDSEASIMFRHLMGNDPRPHYAHQSNLAEDGVLYSLMDEVLRRYRTYFGPPLVQLTHKRIGQELQRQAKWRQDVAAGRVTAYLKDGQVTVTTTATIEVPVTGTPDGEPYGGRRSGWFTVSPGQPLRRSAPASASARARGSAAAARPGSAVRRARRVALRIRRLRMSPRRFAVAHRRSAARSRRGRAPDGTAVTFLLNDTATVRLTVRRVARNGRTVRVTTLRRKAIRGENTVRFSGRIGRRVLRPGRYRMVVRARANDGRRTPARTLRFTVVRG
jgi:hypothetical protein